MNAPMVHYWLGMPITELSREELLGVIDWLGKELQSLRQDRNRWMKAGDPIKYLSEVESP